jgi:uncharacterized phage protein (TIGR02218 family)
MTQLRRDVPAALATLLDSGVPLIVADLYTITLTGGQVLRWTDFDRALTLGALTWVLGPGITSSKLKLSAGVEVDTMTLTLTGDAGQTINGLPMMPFINGGGLDGATVQTWRAFAAAADGVWVGKLHRFTGRVSDIDRPNRLEASISVRSVFEMLNANMPGGVYQESCLNSLYSVACGQDRAALTVNGTVTTGTTTLRLQFTASGLTQAPGYFSLGGVRFGSGGNAGVLRSIRTHEAGGVITLMQPLPVAAVVGDVFQIYPGCDNTQSTCTNKFNNVGRFRGQPYIPASETVL